MERALRLAEQAIGLCSPNPAVGCVITQGGRLVGEGFHNYSLVEHAEVVALRQAGSNAKGATAYVTLEPCSHQGRTGPCANALIDAGIRRAVVATTDPNPAVRGLGIQRLRAAGVEVETHVLQEPARRLNDAFARYIQSSRPFVTLKVASSLDGRIAATGGSRTTITGKESQAEVMRMRHATDAILVGVGTILADNPLLTDRSGLPRRRPLMRVVLDSSLRTPSDSHLVSSAAGDVLIFYRHASEANVKALEERGASLVRITDNAENGPQNHRKLPLAAVLQALAAREITSALVEGGSELNSAMLATGLVDKLTLFIAPLLLGGNSVPMFASAPQVATSLNDYVLRSFGRDFAVESYLHDPWAGVP
jgi:diaminohydroxyphosphoribosylaminopyrimidine deaminase/5-amino-6-(5-phosphoribosylamino)uracil reductase